MKTKVLFVVLALVFVLALAVPAFAAGPDGCDYGETHKSLATSGTTRGDGHIPGNHRGAAGFCLGFPGGSGG